MTLHSWVISLSLNSPGEESQNQITHTPLNFINCREARSPCLVIVYKIILRCQQDLGLKSAILALRVTKEKLSKHVLRGLSCYP